MYLSTFQSSWTAQLKPASWANYPRVVPFSVLVGLILSMFLLLAPLELTERAASTVLPRKVPALISLILRLSEILKYNKMDLEAVGSVGTREDP